jgi:hypothetical protein
MKTKGSSALKYVGATMAVGGTVMLGSALFGAESSVKKKVRKTASKALDVLDGALTSMQNVVK